MAKPRKFDYSHPAYLKAREEALDRDRGMCVFCGESDAEETHHRALRYPPPEKTTADDLVSLCHVCHHMMTTYRRYRRQGGDRWQWKSALENSTGELLKQCSTKSKSAGLGPSSCTTARPDSTPAPLPMSRRQKSPASAALTEPRQTTPDSKNSNAKSPFGSTRRERQQSQKQLLDPASKRERES